MAPEQRQRKQQGSSWIGLVGGVAVCLLFAVWLGPTGWTGSASIPAAAVPSEAAPGAAPEAKDEEAASKFKVFTTTELAEFDGTVDGKKILLAVLGQVFDVTEGKRFYAPPSGYAFFSGKDGSRAFVTGEFQGTGDVPAHHVTDLTDEQLVSIEDWRQEYHKKYIFVGVLYQPDGYYTAKGNPTALLQEVEQRVSAGRVLADKQEEYRKSVPGCNSYFKSGEGGSLWCDNGLLPRRGKLPLDRDVRCACYTKEFADKHQAELKVTRPECDPAASSCAIPANADQD